jgi:flagellin
MGFRVSNRLSTGLSSFHLEKSNQRLAHSIERLSSGVRISRGADDASGLTLSEKLRSQIRGAQRAVNNTQDGISMLQTAEGALNEDAHILLRLKELSIEAQSDALTSNDRIEIQKEVDEMLTEIDRISSTTEFNKRTLLQGGAAATLTSDSESVKLFGTGDGLVAGSYRISIQRRSEGEKQVQTSAFQMDRTTGELASFSTELKDLESMVDDSGVALLKEPETLVIRGNRTQIEVRIDGAMTIEQLTEKIQPELRRSREAGGLEINGASFRFDPDKGQFIFTSGKEGVSGELSISGKQQLLDALGFSVTQKSKNPGFTVSAIETGVLNPRVFESETTGSRSFGLIDGIDFEFDLASEARIDGSQAGVNSITVDANDVVFTLHDTDSQYNGQSPGSISAGVTVTLTRSRTYSLTSIANIVNSAVAVANDPTDPLTGSTTSSNFATPGLAAGFSGYDLLLTSAVGGSSGEVSVLANAAAQSILGFSNGSTSGLGGVSGVLTGTVDISGGVTIAGTGVLRVQVGDGDFNTGSPPSTTTDITFNRGVALTAASVTTAFNAYFIGNGVKAIASLTGTGELELISTESGGDSTVSIASVGLGLGSLGFVSGQVDTGTFGASALVMGNTASANASTGFTLLDQMAFSLSDQSGVRTETITFATSQTVPGESFTISSGQLVSILDASSLDQTAVRYGFDSGNHLDFFSSNPGSNNKITLHSDGSSQVIGQKAFGIDFNGEVQGRDRAEFNLQVKDSGLRFQVGANKGETLGFRIGSASTDSLGLKGLDITTMETATRALSMIDNAVSSIAENRARLGAMQNRMLSTIRRTEEAGIHQSESESRIRDVDLAKEMLVVTREEMLRDSALTQLTHARELGQINFSLVG